MFWIGYKPFWKVTRQYFSARSPGLLSSSNWQSNNLCFYLQETLNNLSSFTYHNVSDRLTHFEAELKKLNFASNSSIKVILYKKYPYNIFELRKIEGKKFFFPPMFRCTRLEPSKELFTVPHWFSLKKFTKKNIISSFKLWLCSKEPNSIKSILKINK